MIESVIQTKVSPDIVWQAWRKAHAMDSGFSPGQKGALKTQGGSRFSYKILDVRVGESFTILWKSLFVRLIFTHSVMGLAKGSKISYRIQIRGFFAWPVRYFLSEKIRLNLNAILKSLVKELEAG
jgi:hypothetical protein